MRYIAANYIFDGQQFVKNCCLSFDDDGCLHSVGIENSALDEKERMIFYNGVVCPHFDISNFDANKCQLRDFLLSLGVHFDKSTILPVVLLENVDLQQLCFTNDTIAREIY